jgi:hypothetical protein
MPVDWTYNLVGEAVNGLVYRLDRLVRSIPDEYVIESVALVTGANTVPHGGRAKHVRAFLRGTDASIGLSVGEIAANSVKVYATADCTADVWVRAR